MNSQTQARLEVMIADANDAVKGIVKKMFEIKRREKMDYVRRDMLFPQNDYAYLKDLSSKGLEKELDNAYTELEWRLSVEKEAGRYISFVNAMELAKSKNPKEYSRKLKAAYAKAYDAGIRARWTAKEEDIMARVEFSAKVVFDYIKHEFKLDEESPLNHSLVKEYLRMQPLFSNMASYLSDCNHKIRAMSVELLSRELDDRLGRDRQKLTETSGESPSDYIMKITLAEFESMDSPKKGQYWN